MKGRGAIEDEERKSIREFSSRQVPWSLMLARHVAEEGASGVPRV